LGVLEHGESGNIESIPLVTSILFSAEVVAELSYLLGGYFAAFQMVNFEW
jgi:hypothetical protein